MPINNYLLGIGKFVSNYCGKHRKTVELMYEALCHLYDISQKNDQN